jgi:hypothetical protein
MARPSSEGYTSSNLVFLYGNMSVPGFLSFWTQTVPSVVSTQEDSNFLCSRNQRSSLNSFNFSLFLNRIDNKNRSASSVERFFKICAPREIRTLVLALKGLRPGPLDDGGERRGFYHIVPTPTSIHSKFAFANPKFDKSSQFVARMV